MWVMYLARKHGDIFSLTHWFKLKLCGLKWQHLLLCVSRVFLNNFTKINIKKRSGREHGHCQMKNTASILHVSTFNYPSPRCLFVVVFPSVRRFSQVNSSQLSLWQTSFPDGSTHSWCSLMGLCQCGWLINFLCSKAWATIQTQEENKKKIVVQI